MRSSIKQQFQNRKRKSRMYLQGTLSTMIFNIYSNDILYQKRTIDVADKETKTKIRRESVQNG